MVMSEKKAKTVGNRPRFDRGTLIIVIIFGVIGLALAVGAYLFATDFFASWNMTSLPGDPVGSNGETLPTLPGGTPAVPTPVIEAGPAPQPWDGKSRINVLLMGLDYRDWEAGETPRTDTMMLLTLDPLSMSAGMLSIPRDMWVLIPGFDYARINTAYFLGESNKMPGGGPQLAAETVQEFLGVPVNYYAQIDFSAFVRFIDEINGIKLTIPEDITIDPIGKNNKYTLKKGRYAVGGDIALAYARWRYSEGGDFDRAQRQQQVVMAIRERVLSADMFPILLTRAPALYQEISAGIRTNLTLDQVIQLAWLVKDIPLDSIRKGVISPPNQVLLTKSPDGTQDVLQPIPDQIRLLRDELFTSTGAVGPKAVGGDELALAKAEGARISVKNGTPDANIANRTAGFFQSQGLNVVELANADQGYSNSMIIVYSGKPYAIVYLSKLMNIPSNMIINRYNPDEAKDIEVILGNDWTSTTAIP